MSNKSRPALTPDAREKQLVSLAVDLAEKQLRDGTAKAQVIAHFLKLGSERERLERERLEMENKLVEAKIEDIKSNARIEEMYDKALKAMSRYSGNRDYEEDEYDDEEY